MKNKFLSVFIFIFMLFLLVGCEQLLPELNNGGNTGETNTPEITIGKNGHWYINGEDTGFKSKGDKGDTTVITIGENGNWFIDGVDTGYSVYGTKGEQGPQGIQGEKGEDGHTPEIIIGENGNWYIDGEDTGIKATGEKGESGIDGRSILSIDLTNSTGNIDTYTITYSDNTTSTFTVTNGIGSNQIIQGEPGKDGHTPVITIVDGYWYVDDVNTEVRAEGIKGDTGNGIVSIVLSSSEGLVDTYTITYTDGSTTTFKVTNGIDGEQGIQGIQGEKGADGHTPIITIQNGYWYIDGENTNIVAQGVKGDNGEQGLSSYEIFKKYNPEYSGTEEEWIYAVATNNVCALYGHTEVIDSPVEATCAKDGLTEGKHCSVCEMIFVKQEIVTVYHDFKYSYCSNCYCNYYSQNLEFELSLDAKSYSVVGIKDTIEKNIVIPATYKGKPVTNIAEKAFFECDFIESVTIQDGIKSIDDSAFAKCTNLTSIEIPDSVTYIGLSVFFNCRNLINISLPKEIKCISSSLFSGCDSLSNVIIPEGVTSIEDDAFWRCDSLINMIIPNSVTSIGKYAFSCCSSLSNIDIPNSVKSVGNYAFSSCSSLTSIAFPIGLKNIEVGLFSSCSSLTSVIIPEGVTSIGEYAFWDCTNLTNIIIPNTVTSIGKFAFLDCNSVESITMPFYESASDYTNDISLGTFFEGFQSYENSSSVPTSLKEVIITSGRIGYCAFSYCDSIERVVIQNGVTSIGYGAFEYCDSLTSITIPFVGATLNETEYTHFGYIFGADRWYLNEECVPTSLKEVIITGGNSICDDAFYGCASLENIVIPNSVTSIGEWAFESCDSLTSITIPFVGATLNGTENTNFDYLFANGNIPTSLKEVIITGGASIDKYAFSYCTSIERIIILDSVTCISSFAFNECYSLKTIVIPNSVTHIGYGAFDNCSSIESITIPFVGQTLYNTDFQSIFGTVENVKNSLKEVIITGGTMIGGYSFEGFSSLENVVISDSITSIGYGAFADCSNLKSITIPFVGEMLNGTSNTNFDYIFEGNGSVPTSLKEVIITGGTSIDENAFSGCSSLENIVVPNSVTSIGLGAFTDCSNLKSITIPFVGETINGTRDVHFAYIFGAIGNSESGKIVPTSLKEVIITGGNFIGYVAFSNCSSIEKIILPNSVTYIDTHAFEYCNSLESIIIPEGVIEINMGAFRNCDNLTAIYCEASYKLSQWYYFEDINVPVYWAGEWKYDANGNPVPLN